MQLYAVYLLSEPNVTGALVLLHTGISFPVFSIFCPVVCIFLGQSHYVTISKLPWSKFFYTNSMVNSSSGTV